MVPQTVECTAKRYLAQLDQLFPDVVSGFYLVGSVALDAYRPGRSDVDFVAVLEPEVGPKLLHRLRLQHARSGLHTAIAGIRQHCSPLTGTCNGVFIRAIDLPKPVSEITPVASQVGHQFRTGAAGSDVSPVAWKVLAERGIPVRGPQPSSLPLDPQPELLRSWNSTTWKATGARGPPPSSNLQKPGSERDLATGPPGECLERPGCTTRWQPAR